MPSRGFAAPLRQVPKLTDLPAQCDKENLPPPVLQEVELVYELEYSFDFQGRKHLDQESSIQKFTFGAQEDISTSYHDHFPMPGLASAAMLREFLRQHLLPSQIVDEYGVECELSDITNDHLPVLQAKMWVKASNNRSAVEAAAQIPSRAQILLAGHVAKISQLLEDKHVFVFSENTKNDSCNYLSDLQVTPRKHACHSRIVRIEPLVHWGTLTPAGPSHFALPFRRDGELMKQPVEHPGYIQLVKRLVMDPPAYCVDCLSYLWSKRAEAREIVRQLQSDHSRPQYGHLEDHPPLRPVLKAKIPGWLSNDACSLAVGGTIDITANNITPAAGELQECFGESLPQLEGSFDRLEEFQTNQLSGSGQDSNAIRISFDSDQPIENDTVHTRLLCMEDSVTPFLHPIALTAESSSGDSTSLPPLTTTSLSTATKIDTSKENRETDSNITEKDYDTQIIDLTTPPRAAERKFGRELDSNAKALLGQMRRSPRNHKTDRFMSRKTFPVPVEPMQPLKSVQRTKAAPKKIKETRKQKPSHVGEQTDKQKKARNIAPKRMIPLGRGETATECSMLSQSQPQPISMDGLQRASKPDSTVQICSPPKLVLHFAKRPTESGIPDGVAEDEWEAFQKSNPASTSKICWCNKPASHGTFRKKDSPQVAQCKNQDCRIRWLHYACLNPYEKRKARLGTLLCSVCHVEQELADQNRKSGWTVEKLMDLQPLYTKGDIEANIPGLGGVVSRPDMYGLALKVELGPKYDKSIRETGTLGGLDRLGYLRSRPEMLEEAYMHAGAYAELLARRAEEDEGNECKGDIHDCEKRYDDDGEVDTE